MSDERLPLSPDNRVETAQMNFRLSGDRVGAHMVEDAVLAVCAPGTSEVLCGTIERAESCQSHVEGDDVAAVDSRDLPGTMDYTRDDAASAVLDPVTASPAQQRAHSGAEDYAEGLGTQTTSISNPATMAVGPTLGTVVARNRSRSPRRLESREETFGLTVVHLSHQFGFRDATLWCWRCGGWSAGSRRASRLKGPCGAPTKTEQMLCTVYLVGFLLKLVYGDPTICLVHLSASRSSKTLKATDSGHIMSIKTTTQSDLPLPVCILFWSWCLGPSSSITFPQCAPSSTKVPLPARLRPRIR